ncbi:MAG TPA: hypothetical protein DHV88_12160 [Roseburia sp.]|nr:hypothetical protein [Roseburia sp.]
MFSRIAAQSVRYQYIIKSARSTWNFVQQQATLAQGSASEAHLNMDVNMRRLPELIKDAIEILSAPAGFMPVLERIACAAIQLKCKERYFLYLDKSKKYSTIQFIVNK